MTYPGSDTDASITAHQSDDCDSRPEAHHHTIGINPGQAADATHNHDGKNSLPLSPAAISGLIPVNYPRGILISVVGASQDVTVPMGRTIVVTASVTLTTPRWLKAVAYIYAQQVSSASTANDVSLAAVGYANVTMRQGAMAVGDRAIETSEAYAKAPVGTIVFNVNTSLSGAGALRFTTVWLVVEDVGDATNA